MIFFPPRQVIDTHKCDSLISIFGKSKIKKFHIDPLVTETFPGYVEAFLDLFATPRNKKPLATPTIRISDGVYPVTRKKRNLAGVHPKSQMH